MEIETEGIMVTFYKKFEEVNEDELNLMKETGVIEGLQLEFKRELSNLTSLVEEVVSFANTRGGDLFIGVGETQDGTIEIEGISDSPDKMILRIKNAIEGKTDPRLINVMFQPILLTNGKNVVHIRVPRSWNAPHMVKDNYKFMIRTGSAKIPAGTSEIRSIMDQRGYILDRYERFRVQRAEKSLNVYHEKPPFILLHYVPVSAFDITSNYPVVDKHNSLIPFNLGLSIANSRINADGVFSQETGQGSLKVHTQIFRNGIIEQVSNLHFPHHYGTEDHKGRQGFDVLSFEEDLRDSIDRQMINYRVLGMQDPFYIFVSMIGGMGVCALRQTTTMLGRPPQAIDEDFLKLPEILIESSEKEKIEHAVTTICLYFWNAFGFQKKPNQDTF